MSCKKSSDCPDNQVCEKKECRENKRDKPIDYYKELCKKKGIPIVYEVGPHKGETKPKEALKRCIQQKKRSSPTPPPKPKTPSPVKVPCKKSADCPDKQVCDKKLCRENKRDKSIEYYIELCKKRNIAVEYKVGKFKGQQKPLDALKRCVQAKKL